MFTLLPVPHSLCRSGITWTGRETTCWVWHDWPKTFWPKFPTSSFLTWRAGESNPIQRRLHTHHRDTHTTHRSELLNRSFRVSLPVSPCVWTLRDAPRYSGVSVRAISISARFFLGRTVWPKGSFFCLFCLKISISWPVTVSYFVDQLTRGWRAGGGGGGWCLWFQLVPVCDCLSVPGQVCPNLTLDRSPHR